MPPKVKKKLTRSVSSEELYAGGPQILPEGRLPTYRDVARYYHHLSRSDEKKDIKDIVIDISEKLVPIWVQVSDKLLLISSEGLFNKLKLFCTKVNNVRVKKIKVKEKNHMDKNLDRIFDIAKCKCSLKNNAFCLLPENMLYSMLLDDDQETRALAIHRIMKILIKLS